MEIIDESNVSKANIDTSIPAFRINTSGSIDERIVLNVAIIDERIVLVRKL